MTLHFVGTPGQRPRAILAHWNDDHLANGLREGEVALLADEVGDYVISQDGTELLPYEFTTDEKWRSVRIERAALLLASDWTQMPDVPEGTRNAWAEYRQALRDITEFSSPEEVVWPTAPGS